MTALQNIAIKGTDAVKRLRRQTLAQGYPFMINDDNLSSGQCYLELPDGSIQLVKLATNGRDFDLIHALSVKEGNDLREKHGLSI